MTEVVNIHHGEFYDVYIGRGSKWGNPYSHLPYSKAQFQTRTREEAIEKYRKWLEGQEDLMKSLGELKGKRLGCYCKPSKGFRGLLLCHGQILAGLCDGISPNQVE